MNRRSFLARFVGGLAAISLRLEELPKAKIKEKVFTGQWNNYYVMYAGNRFGKTYAMTRAIELMKEERIKVYP